MTDSFSQHFLESCTDDSLIPSVQTLVSSIRTDAGPPKIMDDLAAITSTTSQIIKKTSQDAPRNDKQLNLIMQTLSENVERLEDAKREGEAIRNEKDWNAFVKRLPPMAFAITKTTKELRGWVDNLDGNDEFS